MKVNRKYLENWFEEKLKTVRPELKLQEIKSINHTYQTAFVYRLMFVFKSDANITIYVYCYYTMKELTYALNNGEELEWKLRDGKWLNESILITTKCQPTILN